MRRMLAAGGKVEGPVLLFSLAVPSSWQCIPGQPASPTSAFYGLKCPILKDIVIFLVTIIALF